MLAMILMKLACSTACGNDPVRGGNGQLTVNYICRWLKDSLRFFDSFRIPQASLSIVVIGSVDQLESPKSLIYWSHCSYKAIYTYELRNSSQCEVGPCRADQLRISLRPVVNSQSSPELSSSLPWKGF